MDERRPRPRRWGVRTVLLLVLALGCVLTSNVLHGLGKDELLLLPFAGTLVALAGASYCTYRGMSAGGWPPRR